jgi:hypothetical protein
MDQVARAPGLLPGGIYGMCRFPFAVPLPWLRHAAMRPRPPQRGGHQGEQSEVQLSLD